MGRDEPPIQPFHKWYEEYDRGRMNDETTQAFAALTEAVHLHAKKGRLTITVDVEPNGANATQMSVVTDVVIKAPTAGRPRTLYYYDSETGGLVRDDPLQEKLPLRRVDEDEGGRGDLRRVTDEEPGE